MMANDPNETFPVFIERRLKVQQLPDQAISDAVIEIGHPYWKEPGIEAACPVAIRGCVGRVNDILGIDPMSAMKQAIAFVETYLDCPGGSMKFFWPSGEEY